MQKLLLLVIFFLLSLHAIASSLGSSDVPTVPVAEISQYKDYKIIDVRTEDEFRGDGHIKGAERVTLGPELDLFLKRTSKETKIIFVCRSGRRSEKAVEQAIASGFKNVRNLEGGMQAYNSLAQ